VGLALEPQDADEVERIAEPYCKLSNLREQILGLGKLLAPAEVGGQVELQDRELPRLTQRIDPEGRLAEDFGRALGLSHENQSARLLEEDATHLPARGRCQSVAEKLESLRPSALGGAERSL